jgi:two-component system, chemotaxis family, CheB/CheR fusion protein
MPEGDMARQKDGKSGKNRKPDKGPKAGAGRGRDPGERTASRKSAPGSKAVEKAAARNEKAGKEPAGPQPGAATPEEKDHGMLIVGIGASAGGLDAFLQLFGALPDHTGMAFVVIQHMDPRKESLLSEILGRQVKLPVVNVSEGMKVEPDRIHVIPAGTSMAIEDHTLSLAPRSKTAGLHMPVDTFFRSLARDKKEKAVGIILSGTASDGALGIRAIKAEGGITFAQDEKSAKYTGMPASAAATDCVDFIMPPDRIARELVRIADHPYVAQAPAEEEPREKEAREKPFDEILAVLQDATGVDFTSYKPATINRRIHRRMALHRLEKMPQYVKFLIERPEERKALFDDLLIDVTSFFRDPEAFEALKEKVFPEIVRGRPRTAVSPVRIWVPGCSTGEEVYSIAIALIETLGDAASVTPVQIFGTDLNEAAVEEARTAFYPESIAQDVSPERLQRFFVKSNRGYQVGKPIREMCIFARQNLVKDPPFSRLDLVSCRNVLIYMKPNLQKKILPVFHYALKPSGYLFLGSSETVGEFVDLFAPVDRRHRIYVRKATALRTPYEFGLHQDRETVPPTTGKVPLEAEPGISSIEKEVDTVLLARFAPPGVLVNEHFDILQFRGRTGAYLSPAPGTASLNLLRMAREGLVPALRTALQKARNAGAGVRSEGVTFQADGRRMTTTLEIIPIRRPPEKEFHFLVLFGEAGPPASSPKARPRKREETTSAGPFRDEYIRQLEQELQAARESMQSVLEEHEAASEEVRSANEELQSANEELQSMNEELETAREELQSANEELTTVNEELANRNEEIAQANNDLVNFVDSANIPIIRVGHDLRIRRFTAYAEEILNLIPGDIGRPIGDIRPNIEVADLDGKILEVIGSLQALDIEVRSRDGRWHVMRIRPYKTADHRIDGAVISLFDIDRLKKTQIRLKEFNSYLQAVFDTVREPLLILRDDLRIEAANRSFYEAFRVTKEETEDRNLYKIGNGQWAIPRLRELLEKILPESARLRDFPVEHEFPGLGRRRMLLNAALVEQAEGIKGRILLAIEDITDRQPKEEAQ